MRNLKDKKKPSLIMHILYYFWLFFTIVFSDKVTLYSNICAIGIMVVGAYYLLRDKRLVIHREIIWLLFFTLFGFLSAIWSPIPSYTLTRAKTLLKLLVFLIMFVSYIDKTGDTEFLLTGLEIMANIIAIYTIYRYGFNSLKAIMLTNGRRVGGEFVNENTLGLFLMMGNIITLFKVICFSKPKRLLFVIIPFAVSLMTASRKVILIIPVALIIIFSMKMKSQSSADNKMKSVFIVVLVFVIGISIYNTPLANTLRNRLSTMIGNGSTLDYSVRNRYGMIELGLEIFKEYPLLGVGLNGSLAYANGTYLHSNYVELLATGGIVGSLIYYAYYLYIFGKMYKVKTEKTSSWRNLGLLFFAICLITDAGAVTYFSKTQYLYFIIFAIAIGKHSKASIIE